MIRFLTRGMRYLWKAKSVIDNQRSPFLTPSSIITTGKKSSLHGQRHVITSTTIRSTTAHKSTQYKTLEAKHIFQSSLAKTSVMLHSSTGFSALLPKAAFSTVSGSSGSEFIQSIEVCLRRMQRKVDYALQSYRFIGHTYGAGEQPLGYKTLQEEVERVLRAINNELHQIECILVQYRRHVMNPMLELTLKNTWSSCEYEARERLNNLGKKAQELSPKLPETQQQHLQTIIRQLSDGFSLNTILDRADLLDYLLKERLLQATLDKVKAKCYLQDKAPGCFISYSWSSEPNVAQVHRIAQNLKHAGVQVILDIWSNSTGSVEKFTNLINDVDAIIVVGTPDLVEKWKNFTTDGQSRGKRGRDYQSHVVVRELKKILYRLEQKPNDTHGIINLLLQGDHHKSFPSNLVDLPSDSTDFRDRTSYVEGLLSLLAKLLPKMTSKEDHHRILDDIKQEFISTRNRLNSWSDDQLLAAYQLSDMNTKKTTTEYDQEIWRVLTSSEKQLAEINATRDKEWRLLPDNKYNFIGREALLKRLNVDFTTIKINSATVFSIVYGLDGIGKTQLVIRYAHASEDLYTIRIWFNASDYNRLLADYRNYAHSLRLFPSIEEASPEEIILKVKQYLEAHPGWLLIYDNACAYHDFEKFLPATGGHLIVTIRQKDWSHKGTTIEVNAFTETEAIEYLKKSTGLSGEKEEKAMAILAKELGYFPAALAHAGSYIKKEHLKAHGFTVAVYLEQFYQYKTSLSEIEKEEKEEKEKSLRSLAVIQAIVYLNPKNIPRILLEKWLQINPVEGETLESLLDKVIAQLRKYSLIEAQINKKTVSVTPMLQETVFLLWILPKSTVGPSNSIDVIKDLIDAIERCVDSEKLQLEEKTQLLPHLQALHSHCEKQRPKAISFIEKIKLLQQKLIIKSTNTNPRSYDLNEKKRKKMRERILINFLEKIEKLLLLSSPRCL